MIEGPYSPLKVFHHQDRIAKLRAQEPGPPAQVQLFISDLCSMQCAWCAYRWEGYDSNQLFPVIEPDGTVNNNPNRTIPYEKAIEILDDCSEMGVKAIQFTGGGEPTVHKRCADIFEHTLNIGLELALVTHGAHLTPRLSEILTRRKCKWVRISVDAGRATTYAHSRHVSVNTYDRVADNVERLVAAKGKNHDPIIGIGFVVTRENWMEVVEATHRAREWGVDNIRISAVFQPDNEKYFADFYDRAAEDCRRAQELATNKFRVFNLFGDRLGDLRERSPDYVFCGYQHFNTLIGASLDIYRCCNTAYNKRGYLGSVKDVRFKDVWFSQELQQKLWQFDARGCARCMFLNKCRTIIYAMDTEPEHVNFV